MLGERSWPTAPTARGWQGRQRSRPSPLRRCPGCSSSSGADSPAGPQDAVPHRTRLRTFSPCAARCRNATRIAAGEVGECSPPTVGIACASPRGRGDKDRAMVQRVSTVQVVAALVATAAVLARNGPGTVRLGYRWLSKARGGTNGLGIPDLIGRNPHALCAPSGRTMLSSRISWRSSCS